MNVELKLWIIYEQLVRRIVKIGTNERYLEKKLMTRNKNKVLRYGLD